MKIQQLFEAPIADFTHVGDFTKSSGFRHEQDRKLVTNPKALTKMQTKWRFPEEQKTNVIFVNHADGNRHTEVGEVSLDWLEKNMPRVFPELEAALDDDALNVIYTNNKGTERVPMTGWILAHRLGHAFFRRSYARSTGPGYYYDEAHKVFYTSFTKIGRTYGIHSQHHQMLPFNGPMIGLMQNVGTMKSAREKNLRNPFELLHECFAQYIFLGEVKFNEAPRSFRYGNRYYSCSEEDVEYNTRELESCAFQLTEYFLTSMQYADGRIYVM